MYLYYTTFQKKVFHFQHRFHTEPFFILMPCPGDFSGSRHEQLPEAGFQYIIESCNPVDSIFMTLGLSCDRETMGRGSNVQTIFKSRLRYSYFRMI